MAKGGRHDRPAPRTRKATDMARRQGRTRREALEMFLAEGKHEEAEMLARLLAWLLGDAS